MHRSDCESLRPASTTLPVARRADRPSALDIRRLAGSSGGLFPSANRSALYGWKLVASLEWDWFQRFASRRGSHRHFLEQLACRLIAASMLLHEDPGADQ